MLIKRDRNSVCRASRPHDAGSSMEFCVANRSVLHPHRTSRCVSPAQSIYVLRDNLFRLNDGGQIVARFGYVARGGNGIHADLPGKERETIREKKNKRNIPT